MLSQWTNFGTIDLKQYYPNTEVWQKKLEGLLQQT